MTRDGLVALTSPALTATVSPHGAELQSIADAEGRSLLWDGDPHIWKGRAPILFPVIGLLHDDGYRLDDRRYAMPKHGFARDADFAAEQSAPDSAVLTLTDSPETFARYPFRFTLAIRFALEGAALRITATIANRGDDPMPFSFGFHPAFRWPLPYGAPRDGHRIRFAAPEGVPLRRIDGDGFLTPVLHDSLIRDRILMLHDEQFVDDAMIFEGIASRSVRYGVPGHPALDIAFPDMSTLGVWTKPGAGYVCIEPWAGISEPEGWDGDLRDKPGSRRLAPGDARRFGMTIALKEDFDEA
ncbi:aldose 1-epimerase family protein [Novosphingopyxis sp.]|uniref:aldose 1-epimerase family protein n=1 Tax=Novosphingopyxis sp. TaxID=2709690 RepID=UPI003B591392